MIAAPYSPAFGPSSAPGAVGGGSEPGPAASSAVSVYEQVLSANTSPQSWTDQKEQLQNNEISGLRARLFQYKGEVEKLSLTASLVSSLESGLKNGIVEELYSVSVDLYDAKLQVQEALEASVQERNGLQVDKGKLQAEVQESQDELDDCKREIFQFQRDLEDALVAVQDAKLTEETRRKDDIRRLESVDSARALLQTEKDALQVELSSRHAELSSCKQQCATYKDLNAKLKADLAEKQKALVASEKATADEQERVVQMNKQLQAYRARSEALEAAARRGKEEVMNKSAQVQSAMQKEMKAFKEALTRATGVQQALEKDKAASADVLSKLRQELVTVRRGEEALQREVAILRRQNEKVEQRAQQDRKDATKMSQQLADMLEEQRLSSATQPSGEADGGDSSERLAEVERERHRLVRELQGVKQENTLLRAAYSKKQRVVDSLKREIIEATETSAGQQPSGVKEHGASYHAQRLQTVKHADSQVQLRPEALAAGSRGRTASTPTLNFHERSSPTDFPGSSAHGQQQAAAAAHFPVRGGVGGAAVGEVPGVSSLLLEGYTDMAPLSNLLMEGYTVAPPARS